MQMKIEGPFIDFPVPLYFGLWKINSMSVYLRRKNMTNERVNCAVEKLETALINGSSLMNLMDEFSPSMIEQIASCLFPDLFKSYLRKTIEQYNIQDYHELMRQAIYKKNVDEYYICNLRFEELIISTLEEYHSDILAEEMLLGYKICRSTVTACKLTWYWVNGHIVRVNKKMAKIIKNSSAFIEIIEDIRQKLLSYELFSYLNDEYGFRFLQDAIGSLFPDLFRQYFIHFLNRRIDQGCINPGFTETLREMFGCIYTSRANEKFYYIAWDVFTQAIYTKRMLNIEGVNICSLGPVAYAKNCWNWQINGVRFTILNSVASGHNDVLNTYKKTKKYLEQYIPFKREEFGAWLFLKLAANLFKELFESYLRHFAQLLMIEGEIISKEMLINRAVNERLNPLNINRDKVFCEIFDRVTTSEYILQQENYLQKNRRVDFYNDIWKLYYLRGTSTRFSCFDFSSIKPTILKREVKYYFKDLIDGHDDYYNVKTGLIHILRALEFLTAQFPTIQRMADIQQIHVESLLIHLENHSEATNGQKQRLAVSSQNDVIRNCGYLIDFLMQHAEKIVTVNPNQNYFSMVTYYNLPSMEKNTEYIPESIVSQLLMHINDICDAYQRILLIMLNCGLRFKEVAYLEEDCLNPISGESEYYKLRYIPWKVLESRRDRGLDDYHTIPIHKDIAEEIIAQTEDTKDTRLIWGLKEIFIKDYSYKAIIYEAGSFCDAANRCIKKNDIKVEGSTDPWRFKSRQCRKTFAVDMIENGATTEEVAAMLGHMQDATTEKYYAEVRKMRLADMNAEFYKKKFQVLITDEYLEKFTEVERKKLFIDFCMGYRERELGYCGKPFSEGPCSKRTGKVNCVNCTKLCVGEKHLPKCKDMAISQKSLVDSLIQTYKNEGIEEAEFEAYREYKAEKHWLNLYDEIVRKIEAEFSGVVDNKNIDNIIMEKG